jgi:hypothetical protein
LDGMRPHGRRRRRQRGRGGLVDWTRGAGGCGAVERNERALPGRCGCGFLGGLRGAGRNKRYCYHKHRQDHQTNWMVHGRNYNTPFNDLTLTEGAVKMLVVSGGLC